MSGRDWRGSHALPATSGNAVNVTSDQTVAGNKTFADDVVVEGDTYTAGLHVYGAVTTETTTATETLRSGIGLPANSAAATAITGSRGGNAALAQLLTALAAQGLIRDQSSA